MTFVQANMANRKYNDFSSQGITSMTFPGVCKPVTHYKCPILQNVGISEMTRPQQTTRQKEYVIAGTHNISLLVPGNRE